MARRTVIPDDDADVALGMFISGDANEVYVKKGNGGVVCRRSLPLSVPRSAAAGNGPAP